MYDGEKSYYLVNPSGTVHNLPETLARERLRIAGWRLATKKEIAALFKRRGIQNTKSRIVPKWEPEALEDQELPDQSAIKKPPAAKKRVKK